jgi:hypothetical protein
LIGGNEDLDLLSLFPKKYARNIYGMDMGKVLRINSGGDGLGKSRQ